MIDINAKEFRAVSVAGGEAPNMTLKEARDQVEAWESKGYSSYVEHMYDDSWEDVEYESVIAPITVHQVAESLGHDRVELERFTMDLIELLGWEVEVQEDGTFVVDKRGEIE